jgi:hypothetical protein
MKKSSHFKDFRLLVKELQRVFSSHFLNTFGERNTVCSTYQ